MIAGQTWDRKKGVGGLKTTETEKYGCLPRPIPFYARYKYNFTSGAVTIHGSSEPWVFN